MSIQVLNAAQGSQGPIDAEDLKRLVLEEKDNLQDSKETARKIALKLSIKSSKHKFLVLVTKIDQKSLAEFDMNIQSVVGAVWDDQKDGYLSFRVDDMFIHIVTVYWIHVG